MDNYFFVFTPQQKNHHSEFYKYIESFPHLPIKRTDEQLTQDIHAAIKTQFLFTNKEWAKRQIKIRECLKLENPRYIQFCLDNKIGNISIKQAAVQAGVYSSHKVSRHGNQKFLEHQQHHH